jgi:hypothetical protein
VDPEPLSNRRNREQAGVRDTSLLDTPKRVERKARIVRDLFGRDIQLVAPSTKRRSESAPDPAVLICQRRLRHRIFILG